MSLLRLAEAAAWIAGACIFAWIILDAWRTGRRFDENLLLSSREGEIEKDLEEVASSLEQVEDGIDRLPGPKA
jgi:hypothetical protein